MLQNAHHILWEREELKQNSHYYLNRHHKIRASCRKYDAGRWNRQQTWALCRRKPIWRRLHGLHAHKLKSSSALLCHAQKCQGDVIGVLKMWRVSRGPPGLKWKKTKQELQPLRIYQTRQLLMMPQKHVLRFQTHWKASRRDVSWKDAANEGWVREMSIRPSNGFRFAVLELTAWFHIMAYSALMLVDLVIPVKLVRNYSRYGVIG